MATKNAPFYSSKANRPDTLRSHRTLKAACSAAGECGQVWIASEVAQKQVHKSTNGSWMTVEGTDGIGPNLEQVLVEHGLISLPGEPAKLAKPKGWADHDRWYTQDSRYGVKYMCVYCGKRTLGFYSGASPRMHRPDCPAVDPGRQEKGAE